MKGVIEGGGVVDDLGGASKKLPLPRMPLPFMGAGEEPNGGGEAGEGGPLEVPGGLILFSFCRLE